MDKETAADIAMQAELNAAMEERSKKESIPIDVALAASAEAHDVLVGLLGKKAPPEAQAEVDALSQQLAENHALLTDVIPAATVPEPKPEPKLTLFSLAAKVRKLEEAIDMLIDDNARLRREIRTGRKRVGAIPQGAGIVDQSGGRR